MSRQSEFKKRFDPEMGKYTRQHIWENPPAYGSGFWGDTFKSIGKKVFGKTVKSTVKSAAKKGMEKGLTNAATKTGDYVGKKAGDKIVQMLSKGSKPKKSTSKKVRWGDASPQNPPAKKNSQFEINKKALAIFSGGKII